MFFKFNLLSLAPLQVKALRAGADVVVATPGRLEDLVQEGSCRLSGVTYLVLDEADRMLDLGFEPHIRSVLFLLAGIGGQLRLSHHAWEPPQDSNLLYTSSTFASLLG